MIEIDKIDIPMKDYIPGFSEKLQKIKQYLNHKGHHKGFIRTNGFEREQMLFEAIELYENKYFYGATGLIWSFIEKLIRDYLSMNEFKKKQPDINKIDYFSLFSVIEKEFEDSNIEDQELNDLFQQIKGNAVFYNGLSDKQKQKIASIRHNTWSYNNMIKKMLSEELISSSEFKQLQNSYKNYRNCVQHGVYKRMYNQLRQDGILEFEDMISTTGIFEMTEKVDFSIPADSEFYRKYNIYLAFHIVAQISFDIVHMLMQKFDDSFADYRGEKYNI